MTKPHPELGVTEQEYIALNPDAEVLGMSALEHFRIFGRRKSDAGVVKGEPRDRLSEAAELTEDVFGPAPAGASTRSALSAPMHFQPQTMYDRPVDLCEFDPIYYLRQYPDVQAAGLDPRWHYYDSGWKEGRNPNANFSVSFYLRQYPDVADAGIEPLEHFALSGLGEGRSPNFREHHKGRTARALSERTPLFRLSRKRRSAASACSLAVHVHCYFIDVFETEILPVLSLMPAGFALFVSTSSRTSADAVRKLTLGLKTSEVDVRVVENRGRDLAPLFVDFFEELQRYEVCLHLHTKKSVEKADFGARWRADLNRTLFASSAFVQNTLGLIMDDPTIGLIGPRPFPPIRRFMVWGSNYEIASRLLNQVQRQDLLPPPGALLDFPAGSFFWFRPSALIESRKLGLTTKSFPSEPIPDDGTIAHSLERILPALAQAKGFRYVEVAPLPFEAEHPAAHPVAVSVIIPAFNAAQFVEQAVLSVVRQTCHHVKIEIIVVDNASTDETGQVLARLASVIPNLSVYFERMPGAGAARNRGLREAKGAFVTFLDADDILMEDAIGELYDAMLASSQSVDFVTSSLQMFRTDWLSHPMPYPDDGSMEQIDLTSLNGNEQIWALLSGDFGACTKLYRRSFLDRHGIRFPEGLNFEDNFFVGSVLAEAQSATVLRSVTYLYRKSQAGETQSTRLSPEILADQVRVIELLLDKYDDKRRDGRWATYKETLLNKLRHEADRVALPIREVVTVQSAPRTHAAIFSRPESL
jgi:glycosyltransferase involved in cell wall biosynthesis